jgi:hypothetical protein
LSQAYLRGHRLLRMEPELILLQLTRRLAEPYLAPIVRSLRPA